MPDDEELDESEESEGKKKPKKRSRLKLVFLLLMLIVLLVGVGGGVYWQFFLPSGSLSFSELFGGDKDTTEGQAAEGKKSDSGSGASLAPQPVLKPISLPSFTVNLSDASGKKYLRVGIDVELSSQEAIKRLEEGGPRVRDAIILLLSSKTSNELATSEGKVILKNEIADRLNQILGAPRVVRIYFTDFVIQ